MSTGVEILLSVSVSAFIIAVAVAWWIIDARLSRKEEKKLEEAMRKARYAAFMAGIAKGKDRSA